MDQHLKQHFDDLDYSSDLADSLRRIVPLEHIHFPKCRAQHPSTIQQMERNQHRAPLPYREDSAG